MTLILVALVGLVLALGAVAFSFYSKSKKQGSSDQSMLMLQQQISSLNEQFRVSLESNATQVTHFLQQQSGQIQTQQQNVGNSLDGVSKTLGERLDNAARIVSQLNERMARVEEVTRRVSEVGRDIASLHEILRAPKLRGNLGEQFLGDLLAQMLPQDSYELQYNFKNGERVDAVIRTAHGLVPVDAKFPLENFQRLLLCKEEDERKTTRKLFMNDVKKHIDDISKKYIRPGENTFDFALMYVPAENVYYEIITKEDVTSDTVTLASYAMQKRVIPVSPNTFYAYLNTILLGLRGLRVEKYAKEIMSELKKVEKELQSYGEDFRMIGKHLSNAVNAFEKADKRFARLDDRVISLAGQENEKPSALLPVEEEKRLQ